MLNRWHQSDDAKRPSEARDEAEHETAQAEEEHEDAEELSEGDSEEVEDGNEGQEDEDAQSEEQPKRKVADDELVRKIRVDGQEIEVKVRDLERLYGQEASLTKKSQEVASQRARIEEETQKVALATEALLKRAVERYQPYANIDWLVESQRMDPAVLTALREEAVKAYSDVQFLQTELDGYVKQVQTARQKDMQERANATAKALNDPKTGIPNFREVYPEMIRYAVNQGIPQELVNREVDERALRILHKAMMYDRMQKVETKPVSKQPAKVIKGNVNTDAARKITKQQTKVIKGPIDSTEDIANAFLRRWSDK